MSKIFKLKASRIHDLAMVISSLSPTEIAKHTGGADSIKNIRNTVKIIDEIEEADAAYLAVAAKLDKAVEQVRDEYQEQVKAVAGDKDAEAALLKEANDKVKKVFDAESKKEGFEEAKEKMTEVKISSDDRYKLLKELVEKAGVEKYLSTEALVETLDAIDAAIEA